MTAFHHHRGGSGEPLVLIHGVGHHWRAWVPVLPELEASFDVLAVDSPGFGESDVLPAGEPATIAAYASAFARWFEQLGLDRPHVAGNSMGGGIAIELARRGAVRSATAFSPVGFWTPRERRYCQLSLTAVAAIPRPVRPLIRAAARSAVGRRALFPQLIARPAALAPELAVASRDALWNAPAFDACIEAFSEYRCAPFTADGPDVPLSIVWGSHDRLLLAGRQSRRARRVLPQASHALIDAGHLPCSDAPAAVAAAIQQTVARADRGRGAAPRPEGG